MDRVSGKVMEEEVFESGAMRFLYRNPFRRLVSELVIKRPFFSRLYARGMDSAASRARIKPFIKRYGIDQSEFERPVESFVSFNDFFTRRLRPSARPLDPDPRCLVAPADSKLLALRIGEDSSFMVKGRRYTLRTLTAGALDPRPWTGGLLLIFRLCPSDCHRFFYFGDCTHGPVQTVPGYFHSVSPVALDSGADVYGGNWRQWTLIDSLAFGEAIEVDVAALTVNGIVQAYPGGGVLRRGQGKGFFQYGGSSIVLAFEPGAVELDQDIERASARGLETRVLALSRIGVEGGRGQ